MKKTAFLFFSFIVLFICRETAAAESDALTASYREMDYSFEEPFIRLNPFGRNELGALLKFPTEKPAAITVTISGLDGADNLVTSFPFKTTEHTIPVLGLYPNTANKVTVQAFYEDKTTQKVELTLQTPKIEKRALIVIQKKEKNTPAPDRYYFLHDGVVFDENGWIRLSFSNNSEAVYFLNGELIAEDRNFGLTRYSLLGEKLKHYPFPKGFTSFAHGIAQKPNGNFWVIGSFAGKQASFEGTQQLTHRDFAIEIDFKTGKTVNIIDFAELLNPDRSVIVRSPAQKYGMNDWCHINSVDYDTSDESIVISCRHAGIAKVNEKTKTLKWLFSMHKDLDKSGRNGKGPSLKDKLLTAVNENGYPYPQAVQTGKQAENNFKWPSKTHHASVVIPGSLISVFDNAGDLYDKSVATTPQSNAAVYQIDEKNKTVSQFWFESLPDKAESASSVVYEPEQNSVTVYLSTVADKNQTGLSYGKLIRYDFKTHKPLFEATVYRGGETYFYRAEPFYFQNRKGEKN